MVRTMRYELRSYFGGPFAYVVLAVWLLWNGAMFRLIAGYYAQNFSDVGSGSALATFFGGTPYFFVPIWVFVPLITMRLVAGERQQGTLRLVLTSPVSEVAWVLGKYFAALVLWVVVWLPSVLYVLHVAQFGEVDLGTTFAQYTGVFLLGAYYIAIGTCMSAWASSPAVAAVMTFFVLAGLFLVGLGEFELDGTLQMVCESVSAWSHMGAFGRGLVDSRAVVWALSCSALALFLAIHGVRKARS